MRTTPYKPPQPLLRKEGDSLKRRGTKPPHTNHPQTPPWKGGGFKRKGKIYEEKFFTKKKIIIFSVIVIIIAGAVFYFNSGNSGKTTYVTDVVQKKDLIQSVSEVGTVESPSQIDLNFSVPGKLATKFAAAGDT